MVGDILRRERERQNLSIKDIEQSTSIRALYIEAIENGNYDKLPGTVYAKGFIKNYGNFLKLNGDDLSRQFSEEVNPTPILQSNSSVSNTKGAISRPLPEDQTEKVINEPIPAENNQIRSESETKINSPKLSRNKSRSNSNGGLIAAAAILIVAVVGGLWYYFTNIEGKELAQNTPVQTQSETAEPSASSVSSSKVSASTPDSVSVPTNVVNLQAKFNGQCWTKVIVDGRVAYEGTAEAGQTLSWQGKDRIVVTAGNAAAVEFIENGNNLGVAGGDGAVVEKTFTRK